MSTPSGRPAPAGPTHLALVDIGNTRIAVAPFADGARGPARRFMLDDLAQAVDEVHDIWHAAPKGAHPAVAVASVNPPLLAAFRERCAARGVAALFVIGENLELPLPVDVPEPDKVGADRLCAAAAAFQGAKAACVVADFGTAVTVDLVGDDGMFLGGTILPGMAMSARALHEQTRQLPLVEVGTPAQTLGRDTVSAIRGGIFAMLAGALREITERYATEIGKWPMLIVTGGDGATVAAACDFVDRVVPDLAMEGILIAWRRTFGSPEP